MTYTDNNDVRDSLIAGHTTNVLARGILNATLGLEFEHQLTPWYARVPHDSNLADGPSRLDFGVCLQLGAEETAVDFAVLRECALAGRPGDG